MPTHTHNYTHAHGDTTITHTHTLTPSLDIPEPLGQFTGVAGDGVVRARRVVHGPRRVEGDQRVLDRPILGGDGGGGGGGGVYSRI